VQGAAKLIANAIIATIKDNCSMNIDLAGFPSDNPMPSFCSGIIPGLVKFQQRYVKSHTVFSRSCKVLCTPLFVKDNTASFDACTKACEDCKSCGGTPSFNGTLVCAGAAPCRGAGGKLTCCQGGAPCCGGVCCQAGEDGHCLRFKYRATTASQESGLTPGNLPLTHFVHGPLI
jgi:hypothetical protein